MVGCERSSRAHPFFLIFFICALAIYVFNVCGSKYQFIVCICVLLCLLFLDTICPVFWKMSKLNLVSFAL